MSFVPSPPPEMISDWEQYSEQQEVDPEMVRHNTAQAERMVSHMRTIDLSPKEPIATDEATEAHDCEIDRLLPG